MRKERLFYSSIVTNSREVSFKKVLLLYCGAGSDEKVGKMICGIYSKDESHIPMP